MKCSCKKISIADFYTILAGYKAIQKRKNITGIYFIEPDDQITIDKQNLKKLKGKYTKNIKYDEIEDDIGTTIRYGIKLKIRHSKITCENLQIEYSTDDLLKILNASPDSPESLSINFYYIDVVKKEFINTSLYFKKVIFLAKTKEKVTHNRKLLEIREKLTLKGWVVEKDEDTDLHFTDCFFRNIHVNINQAIWPKKLTQYSPDYVYKYYLPSFLPDANPKIWFKDTTAVLDNTIPNKYRKAGYQLQTSIHRDAKIHEFIGSVGIENCYLHFVLTTGVNLKLTGNNIIKEFFCNNKQSVFGTKVNGKHILITKESAEALPEDIYITGLPDPHWEISKTDWGTYQKITPANDSDWRRHKSYLIVLKDLAEKRQDQAQVNILSREIAICNHNILKEEPFLSSWQDRLTLGFNKWVSNYGISWLRPLLWLLILNALLTVFSLICLNYPNDSNIMSWYSIIVLANMFNPLSSLADSLNLPKNADTYKVALISIINIIQKIVLAIFTYEIIRAGRRLTRQYEK